MVSPSKAVAMAGPSSAIVWANSEAAWAGSATIEEPPPVLLR